MVDLNLVCKAGEAGCQAFGHKGSQLKGQLLENEVID